MNHGAKLPRPSTATIALLAVVSLATGLPVQAQQTANTGGLEEIVVTARQREETLQSIPLAVTAFSSDDMARRAAVSMTDIAALTPGFTFQEFGGDELRERIHRQYSGLPMVLAWPVRLQPGPVGQERLRVPSGAAHVRRQRNAACRGRRSEEHTSELQSH